MKQLHVAVLMGGPSAEREISLQSGATAIRALRGAGAHATEVDVRGADVELPADTDVAFIALHGTFGEDGQLQRILERRGVPYTGSGPETSALAFDKAAAKAKFVAAGIPTPAYRVVEGVMPSLGTVRPPLVIKPTRQGSSVGISIVRDASAFEEALAKALAYDQRLLVEQYIDGRELTVGIFGDRALPIVEIRTNRTFFDYTAKYTPGEAEEIVPAPLDRITTARMQALALRAHACLGCRDMSRVDIMLSACGEMFVLEVNTVPGMTANSLLPKAARAAGLQMQDVCVRLVERALARRPFATATA